MRVIAGSAKGMPLKTVSGMETRPTTDRIKETLFNMLQSYICDCRFLDLFSGSGAIGIEALSRGAVSCVLIEKNKKAANCILENLKFTRLKDKAEVMNQDVFTALSMLEGTEPFDCIFMDPPYGKGLEFQVLEALQGTTLVDEETRIIIEESLDVTWEQAEALGYEIIKEKKYKTNQHVFLKKRGEL